MARKKAKPKMDKIKDDDDYYTKWKPKKTKKGGR